MKDKFLWVAAVCLMAACLGVFVWSRTDNENVAPDKAKIEAVTMEKAVSDIDLVVGGIKLSQSGFEAKKEELVRKYNEAEESTPGMAETKVMELQDAYALIEIINIEVTKGKTFTNVNSFSDVVNQLK